MGRVLRRGAVLGLVVAPLIALHAPHHPGQGPFGLDGSYYMQAARYVAEQDRLMTGVSLYHEGLTPLPGPWIIYPLWPLVLGIAAKAIGLFAAANLLPQLFYALDLVLFALLASRMNARLGGGVWKIGDDTLDAGHVAALVVGLNFIFFEATIYPYTEGLAFAFALASLLVLDRDDWPVLAWAGGAGVLAGLSCLTRYQMVAVPLATAIALLAARRVKSFTIYSAAVTLVVGPWLLYARTLLRFRVGIAAWDEWVHPTTSVGQLAQIARGLAVAGDPYSRASLFVSFGIAVLLLPLALFTRPRIALLPAAVALSGVLSVVMLAHFESKRFDRWLFGERHSLLFLFAVVAALAVCLAQGGRWVRCLALALAAIAVVQGAVTIVATPSPVGAGPSRGELRMIAWLTKNAPHTALLTTNAQPLSVYLRNPLHWTDCGVAPEATRAMLKKLPIEHVIVYGSERDCAFVRGLGDVLKPEAQFDDAAVPIYLFRVTR